MSPKHRTRSASKRSRPPVVAAPSSEASELKERVLHTRVPESLDRRIKHRARNLGLSVSTVVRHVLLNTFGLVEDIVADSTNLALSIAGDDTAASPGHQRSRTERRTAEAQGLILAWQEGVLNLNGACERCNIVLVKGARAAIGVRETPGPRALLCLACLAKLEPE